MKFTLVACTILLAVVVSLEASPVEKHAQKFDFESDYVVPVHDHADRHKRVTCDLLSFDTKWGSINHAACAAHCLILGKGYRGGHCDGNGVCVCRK